MIKYLFSKHVKHTKRTERRNYRFSLLREIRILSSYLSRKRKNQIILLFFLMIFTSFSEIVSLGMVFSFLEALSNADALLKAPDWQPLVQHLNLENPHQLIRLLAVFFMISVALANSLRILTLTAQTRLSANIGCDLSSLVYLKTLYQPYKFHVQHNSSDLLQTLTEDNTQITKSVLSPLLILITDFIFSFSMIGTLILIDPGIALLTTAILGSTYITIYRFRRNLLKRNSKIIALRGRARIQSAQEGLGGIRDIILAETQNHFAQTYRKSENACKQANATNILVSTTPKYLVEMVAMSAIAILALYLGRDGNFTQAVPVLGTLAIGSKRLLPALQEMFGSLAKIQGARTSLTRILVALQRPVDPLITASTPIEPLVIEKELRLDNICFRYDDESPWVLQDLSLSIKARTTVGFVGGTGSGKSTTADLILGLLQPERGKIWLDDRPLDRECLRQWRKSIAHVPQSIYLADATIAENIAFGIPKDEIDFQQVRKAAKLAQVDNYIKDLPAGYETYVGERGIRLSGGQRQRIGIARALYSEATVILFDEATSALDNVTEKEVMNSINSLNRQYTIILIAHRLSTLQNCDQIFEFCNGKIKASGTYQDLVINSESFKQMAGTNLSKEGLLPHKAIEK